ncbi:MAG: PBP1A family penicillin-binding protein [Thermoanaerobaculia bacterium]
MKDDPLAAPEPPPETDRPEPAADPSPPVPVTTEPLAPVAAEPPPSPDLLLAHAAMSTPVEVRSDEIELERDELPFTDPPPVSTHRRRLMLLGAYPLITILVAAMAGVVVAASIHRPQVDTIEDFVPGVITRLYDSQGEEIKTYSNQQRVLLDEGEVPKLLEQAILAIEDVNFYQHGGIELRGILRATLKNIREWSFTEGASTITMQLARDLFVLTRERDVKRKIEEAFLAVELEKKFSKQQILTLYCNMVNTSNGNYGMEAAALNYFNKSVDELTIAEAATLAGIPQRPSAHNPVDFPETVEARRNVVLGRMLDVGFITREEHEAAVAEPLRVAKRQQETVLGAYFSEDVRRFLISTYGQTELYDRGLQVYTTLDPAVQRAAEAGVRTQLVKLDRARKGWRGPVRHLEVDDLETRQLPSWIGVEPQPGDRWYEGLVLSSDASKTVVKIDEGTFELTRQGIEWTRRRQPSTLLKAGDVAWFRLAAGVDEDAEPLLMLEQEPEMEAAVVVLESATGAVRAMVGGWSYERNEFNRVTQARRQVGSAFKPFVYGAALEIGFTVADTVFDGPVVFPDAAQRLTYSPRNFHRKYHGVLTLRRALEKSINVPAVKLLDIVGADRVIDFTRRCGIESDLPPYPSLALGAADIRPIELAAAYATFVNKGVYVEPYLIEKVTSRNGRVMQEHAPRAHKAMEPTVAYLLTDMLAGVAKRGTAASLAKIELATGGKTGTTNNFTDAWFVGFTPRYTLLTWVGYDKKRYLGHNMTGAVAALPIWTSIVERGLEEGWLDGEGRFEVPPGIIEREIEPATGLLASRDAAETIMEVFIAGTEPEKRFDRKWARRKDLPWYLQEPFYIPKEGERMPGQVADWTPVQEVWEEKDR